MLDYRYTALDRSGKEVTGTFACRDASDALARVRALGYYPIDIAPAGGQARSNGRQVVPISGGKARPVIDSRPSKGEAPAAGEGKRVSKVHILLFTRELADLIDAGLPLDRAMSVLIDQSDNDALRFMLGKLQGEIRAGNPLSDALRGFPREFPALYANMVHAGEVSGQLPSVLTRLADFLEKEQIRRSQVVSAMTYPAVLLTVATLAVTFLLTFVIPRLERAFIDMGGELPLPTRMLMGISSFIMHGWWMVILAVAGTVFGFRAWVGTSGGRRTFDGFRMSTPLFGPLTRKIVMARFVRTLGTLLAGGVPILDSLDISASAVGNVVAAEAIGAARDGVRQGETLSESMEQTNTFLPLVVHMAAVGEETGRLPGMLIRTAETLDLEVDTTMRRLTSLVEPLVVLFMGIFVGFVVLSILLPIFQANTLVK